MINIFFIVHDYSGARTYGDHLANYFASNPRYKLYRIYVERYNIKEFNVLDEANGVSILIPRAINYDKYNLDMKYYTQAALLLYNNFSDLTDVILHCNKTTQYSFAIAAKKLFRCPIVFTYHFVEYFHYYFDHCNINDKDIVSLSDMPPGKMMALADHIIFVTRFAQRCAIKDHHIHPEKTSVIYNGMKKANSRPGSLIRNKLKEGFGFSKDDKIILFAGQLHKIKGIDKLIEAYHSLRRQLRNIKLVIAGTGAYDEFMPLAWESIGGISFAGKLDKNTLSLFYQCSDVGVIPSEFEQCSYVAIEMIHHALPLIVSDVPGLNELVIHNKTGLICKVNSDKNAKTLKVDKNILAAQIKTILDAPIIANSLAIAALKNGKQIFSIQSMGEKTKRVYIQSMKSFISSDSPD